jgi:hypothetical protein
VDSFVFNGSFLDFIAFGPSANVDEYVASHPALLVLKTDGGCNVLSRAVYFHHCMPIPQMWSGLPSYFPGGAHDWGHMLMLEAQKRLTFQVIYQVVLRRNVYEFVYFVVHAVYGFFTGQRYNSVIGLFPG